MAANSGVKFSEIESQHETFVVVELGGDFVPWGCPHNWRPLRGLTDTPRTYGRIENNGGHFLMVDGSVRWVRPDVAEEALSKLRGLNLAGDEAKRLGIQRPASFSFPAGARDPWKDFHAKK